MDCFSERRLKTIFSKYLISLYSIHFAFIFIFRAILNEWQYGRGKMHLFATKYFCCNYFLLFNSMFYLYIFIMELLHRTQKVVFIRHSSTCTFEIEIRYISKAEIILTHLLHIDLQQETEFKYRCNKLF